MIFSHFIDFPNQNIMFNNFHLFSYMFNDFRLFPIISNYCFYELHHFPTQFYNFRWFRRFSLMWWFVLIFNISQCLKKHLKLISNYFWRSSMILLFNDFQWFAMIFNDVDGLQFSSMISMICNDFPNVQWFFDLNQYHWFQWFSTVIKDL